MGLEEDKILAQKRHKELIAELRALREKVSAAPHDVGVKEAINNLAESFANMKQPDAPIVNVHHDHKELDALISRIESAIAAKTDNNPEAKAESPREWHHKITRDQNGFIDNVISKAK